MNQKAVYVFKMAGEADYHGIAMDVHPHNGCLRFFDTNRGHDIEGTVQSDGPESFSFVSSGYAPGVWSFKLLTLQDFRRKYYKLVSGGDELSRILQTTDDLHEWYRKEYGF